MVGPAAPAAVLRRAGGTAHAGRRQAAICGSRSGRTPAEGPSSGSRSIAPSRLPGRRAPPHRPRERVQARAIGPDVACQALPSLSPSPSRAATVAHATLTRCLPIQRRIAATVPAVKSRLLTEGQQPRNRYAYSRNRSIAAPRVRRRVRSLLARRQGSVLKERASGTATVDIRCRRNGLLAAGHWPGGGLIVLLQGRCREVFRPLADRGPARIQTHRSRSPVYPTAGYRFSGLGGKRHAPTTDMDHDGSVLTSQGE